VREGHREASELFLALGQALGYRVRRTWSRELPTDGVWMSASGEPVTPELPLVAVEVLVSEGSKSIKGSIGVLTAVSPALGILLVQEEEIRRGLIRHGCPTCKIVRSIARQRESLDALVSRSAQRLDVWSFAQLRRRYEMYVGERTGQAAYSGTNGGLIWD
jgi:hypothetical protein